DAPELSLAVMHTPTTGARPCHRSPSRPDLAASTPTLLVAPPTASATALRRPLPGALDHVRRYARVPGRLVQPAGHPAGVVAFMLVTDAGQPVGRRTELGLAVAGWLLPCLEDGHRSDLQARAFHLAGGHRPTAAPEA